MNLAPASLKKEGAGFDLPIAIGILAALGVVNSEKAAKMIFAESLPWTEGESRFPDVYHAPRVAIQARDCGYSDIILVSA